MKRVNKVELLLLPCWIVPDPSLAVRKLQHSVLGGKADVSFVGLMLSSFVPD
jgi:hypothetical protein